MYLYIDKNDFKKMRENLVTLQRGARCYSASVARLERVGSSAQGNECTLDWGQDTRSRVTGQER